MVVPLFGAVLENTVGNEPRRREGREELLCAREETPLPLRDYKVILRVLRCFAVQIHDPATALNRETTDYRKMTNVT